jgi:hypothetical protein
MSEANPRNCQCNIYYTYRHGREFIASQYQIVTLMRTKCVVHQ